MVLGGMVSWISLIVSWVATRVKYHLIEPLHGDLIGTGDVNLVPEYGRESVIPIVLGYLGMGLFLFSSNTPKRFNFCFRSSIW